MSKHRSTGRSFEDRWLRRRRECGLDSLGPAEFLRAGKVVLPLEAGPFLSFGEAQELPFVHDVYGRAADWSGAERRRLANYWMMGTDGSGNPVCMSARNGAVWILDHENRFRTRQFVNSSVPLLAECLLAYMGENEPAALRAAVRALDRPAARRGTFWDAAAAELSNLREN